MRDKLVFTGAYKHGNVPLLFLDGHRIHLQVSIKFLCLWFKSKLLGKAYINHIANEFLRLKNLFAVMSKAETGTAFQTLDLYAKA